MANLPPLPVNLISLLAYHEIGVAATKAEVIPILDTVNEYDNGFDGTLRLGVDGIPDNLFGTHIVNVRLRTDGLLVAWVLRADEPLDGSNRLAHSSDVSYAALPASRAMMHVSRNCARRNSGGNPAATFLSDDGVHYAYPTTGRTTLLAAALKEMEVLITTPLKIAVNEATTLHFDYQFPTANKFYLLGETFDFMQPNSGNVVLYVGQELRRQRTTSETSPPGPSQSYGINSTTILPTINLEVSAFVVDSRSAAIDANEIATILNNPGVNNNVVRSGYTGAYQHGGAGNINNTGAYDVVAMTFIECQE